MIQLVVFKDGSPYLVDTMGADINLSLQFAEPGEIMSRHGSYSSTFRVPFTPENNRLFEHLYEANIEIGDFDPTRRHTCELRHNTTTLIEGYLQYRSSDALTQTYELAITSTTTDLFTELANIKLRDLFTGTDYDVTPTDQTAVDSWDVANDITNGGVGAGTVVLPLADYGNTPGQYLAANADTQEGLQYDDYLRGFHLKPAIKMSAVWDKIMAAAGYTVESTWMGTDSWTNLYMLCGTEGSSTRPWYGFRAGLASNEAFTSYETYLGPFFTDESTPNFYDPDNLLTSGTYTATGDMTAAFTVSCVWDNTGNANQTSVYVRFMRNGSVAATGFQYVPGSGTDISGNVYTAQGTISLAEGDTVTVAFYLVSPGSGLTLQSDPNTFWRLDSYDTTGLQPISMQLAMPGVSAADFVRDIVQRFNLAIVPDPEEPTVLQIEPLVDFLQAGDTKDWTDKLDTDKPQLLRPTSELKKKQLIFTDGVDEDTPNQWHQNAFGFPLGQYTYSSEDDFATGEEESAGVFGQFNVSTLPRTDWEGSDYPQVVFPRLFGPAEVGLGPVTTKPKLMYYNGLKDAGDTFQVGEVSWTEYAMFSPFKDTPVAYDTESLYWQHSYTMGSDSPYIGNEIARGLVRTYWSEYLVDIYSAEARLMECEMVLTPADVRAFEFSDRIRIDRTTWRVLSIQGYKPYQATKCKVRMLKVVDPVVVHLNPNDRCDLEWTASNLDGTTTWTDADGVTTTDPGEDCCTSEGLTYNDGKCWWQWRQQTGFTPDQSTGRRSFNPLQTVPARRGSQLPFSAQTGARAYANNSTQTPGLGMVQNFELQAWSINGTDALLAVTGEQASQITIPQNCTAFLRISCVGTDMEYSFGNTYGIIEELGIKNMTGTFDEVSQRTADSWHEHGSHPTITWSQETNPATGENDLLQLKIGGPNHTRIWWTCTVQLLLQDMSVARAFTTTLVMEDGEWMTDEGGSYLATEDL